MREAVELVAAWAAQRDHAVPGLAARVGELVVEVIGDDSAVRQLLSEAAAGVVTERTLVRAALAVEDEIERNLVFARDLSTALGSADGVNTMLVSPVHPSYAAVKVVGAVKDAVISDDVDVVGRLFFGRDDAEHDMADGLLRNGFVPTAVYAEVTAGRKNLIIGRKGTGKSAICMRLAMSNGEPNGTYLITPDDAAGEAFRRFALEGLTGPAAKALLWRYVVAVHAARFLVRHASSAATRRRRPSSVGVLERFLRDNNELADQSFYHRVTSAGRGLVSSFSLEAFGVRVAVDAKNAPAGAHASRQLEVVESGVRQAFDDLEWTKKHGTLLVLVDQLEQVWSGEPESAALVVGLLLAGKHVALTYGKSLRCVSFVRSDIYDTLDFGDADKFHSDEIRISWTTHQLRELAIARAGAALGRKLAPDELWGEIFPEEVLGQPTADYLFERTLPRPRDAIQFLNQCRDMAFGNGHNRITEADVVDATLVFSRWKVLDLAKEYGIRFPFLSSLLSIFRDSGHELSRTDIARLFQPFLRDLKRRNGQYLQLLDSDVIIELLFSVGFLGVHRGSGFVYAGTTETSIQPHEYLFCIHPCFRPALNAVQPSVGPLTNVITGLTIGTAIQLGHIHGDITTDNVVAGGDINLQPRRGTSPHAKPAGE
ncbi:hypothetical protein [Amycolatopsis sp. NPDC051102]|uniref:P-loop ATPase, Sll1717 family n=1 Tax=Amycolatopsis sp. NPDC051102 TaxID=3155163 RepID=UPI0034380DDC